MTSLPNRLISLIASSTVLQSLPQLTQASEYRGHKLKPYLEEIPKDAWGEPLYYEYPSSKAGDKPAIWSSGPNRQNEDGGGDDINNWSRKIKYN